MALTQPAASPLRWRAAFRVAADRGGLKFEQRYGWKYLHSASRFSICPRSLGALDILPPHPPEPYALRRLDRNGRQVGP